MPFCISTLVTRLCLEGANLTVSSPFHKGGTGGILPLFVENPPKSPFRKGDFASILSSSKCIELTKLTPNQRR